MRIPVVLFALVAVVSPTHATTIIFGDGVGLQPGFAQRDPVVVAARGGLTLMTPGTYSAASWSISGELRLGAPGNYIVVATAGSIALNGSAKIRGPVGATGVVATLSFAHAGEFIISTPQIDPTIDMRRGAPIPVDSPPLVNMSTRLTLADGQTHTSGFVVGGRVPRRVLVRAVGPTLGTFGVTNALATPSLTVFGNEGPDRPVHVWGGNFDPFLTPIFNNVGAFPLTLASKDAAMLMTLAPGSYTVQVGGGVGDVLLEIYYVEL